MLGLRFDTAKSYTRLDGGLDPTLKASPPRQNLANNKNSKLQCSLLIHGIHSQL